MIYTHHGSKSHAGFASGPFGLGLQPVGSDPPLLYTETCLFLFVATMLAAKAGTDVAFEEGQQP